MRRGSAVVRRARGGVGNRGGHAVAERRGRRGGRRRVHRGRSWPARPPARRRRHGGGHLSQLQTSSCGCVVVVLCVVHLHLTRPARRFGLVTLKGRAEGTCQCGPPVWRSRSNLQCRATERLGHWAGVVGCDKHGSSRRERDHSVGSLKTRLVCGISRKFTWGVASSRSPAGGPRALEKRGAVTVGRPRCAGRSILPDLPDPERRIQKTKLHVAAKSLAAVVGASVSDRGVAADFRSRRDRARSICEPPRSAGRPFLLESD